MALPTLTWTKPNSRAYVNAGTSALDSVAAVHYIFDTTGVTGWSVAYWDATDGILVVKPSDVNVANMRIMFFGGKVPNAAAVDGSITRNADTVYCIVSRDVGIDTIDQSYTVGHPWATSDPDCMGGIIVGAPGFSSAWDTAQIYACEEGLTLHYYVASSGTNSYWCVCGALMTALEDADARIYMAAGSSGVNVPSTTFWSSTTDDTAWPAITLPDAGNPRITGYDVAGNVRSFIHVERMNVQFDLQNYKNEGDTNFYFTPVIIGARDSGGSYYYLQGFLRQVMVGPEATRGNVIVEGGITKGYAVSSNAGAVQHAIWLVNE